MRKSVVLPQPEGPRRQTTSPLATREADIRSWVAERSDITLADLVARREIQAISEKQVSHSQQPNDGEQILVRTA